MSLLVVILGIIVFLNLGEITGKLALGKLSFHKTEASECFLGLGEELGPQKTPAGKQI